MANLHKLHQILTQTGCGQVIQDVECHGAEPLLPVFPKLAEDMLDIVFVDQEVLLHNRHWGLSVFDSVDDLLLVTKRDLGIGDEDGREQGMGSPAFLALHTLDSKEDKLREELNGTLIVTIADQAAALTTGACGPVELECIQGVVIRILRKTIAIVKDNCYHRLVIAQQGLALGALWRETG